MTVALLLAGALGGLVGTAGGIASLVCYPALLAVGVHPLAAGLVNNVAFVTCWPASALASRPELRGRARWLVPWTALAAVGSGAGALLLLSTPPGVFRRVVPALVICGVVALAVGPRLAARRARALAARPSGALGDLTLPAGMVPVAVYNGYFGAGSGIMFLALLTAVVEPHLQRANALKNVLVGAGATAAAATIVASGRVDWAAALPLAAGLAVGSSLGPRVARRLPARPLRLAIEALGVALAIQLWFAPGL
ncbi:MAG TPA: sulfite exporter TauE/SafE family protein [Solirubrobacteraceae bacterium]|nr:sulfite exporter TauE/SafE family protein [Solirubrobacteraceae bacterium]